MKKCILFPILLCGSAFFGSKAFAQLVSDNIFMQGQWLEVCVAPNGSWGNTVPVPAAYHTNPFTFTSGYTDPVTGATPPSTTAIDFSYDVGHDGWTVGGPPSVPFYGPYFMPGTPFDGWSMQVNGVRSDAWYTNHGYWNATGGTLTGNVGTYTQIPAGCNGTPSMMIGTWNGTAGPGGALHITQSNRLDTLASWLVVTIKYVNTSSSPMTGLYYWVSGDPDNDEVIDGSTGSFPTNDHIYYQGGEEGVEVGSVPPAIHQDAFSGLATKDCRAKAFIYEAWPIYPAEADANTLDQVYNGTATWLGGSFYSLDTSTLDQDWAMGLIFKLGDLAPGDSTTLSFAWVFSDSNAVQQAFPGPELSTLGAIHTSTDTVSSCSLTGCGATGTSFTADIIGGNDKDWSQSTWTWSPATGLSATTGTHVTVNMTTISSPTTYIITGTKDVAHGQCGTTLFTLYVTPCFAAYSNGPCPGSALDLSAHGGDSVGATYYWYGPGGFTSTLQDPVIGVVTYADTGVYHVVKTISGVHDTASIDIYLPLLPVVTAGSNSPLCSGSTLSLTATPDSVGETFTWTGPGGFISVLQDPSITGVPVHDSGTYKVITTLHGCSDSALVHVVIDSTPAVPTIGSNAPLCAGQTLHLTSSDATPGVSYSWAGPGGFTSAIQNPNITSATVGASGVYTVTATLGMCSASAMLAVTINPIPAMPTLGSNSPVCSGNSLNLTATDIAGSAYSWVGPNSFSSSLENPVINPVTMAATGTYSVVATFAGCVSPQATESVVIDSTPVRPTMGSNGPVCAGTTLLLTSSDGTAGVSFSWAGPSAFTSAVQNPTITTPLAAASGVYTVTATLGICSSWDSLTVVVNLIPAAPGLGSFLPLCSGNALDLTATDPPGSTYSWTGPNGFSSTLQNPVINPASTLATGTYSVVATLNGCVSPMATESIVVDSTPVIPTIIGSNSPICSGPGNTLLLNASSPTAGVSYNWTGPLSFTSPLQNPSILAPPATASGSYTVTVTLGACSSWLSTPVVIKPTPSLTSVSSNAPICSGNTLLLTCLFAPTGGAYYWTGPNSFTSVLQDPSILAVTTAATGVYSVSETLAGCTSPTVTLTVEIDSTPQVPMANSNSPGAPGPSICKSDTLKLISGDGTAGVAYSWVGPNSFTSTLQDPDILNVGLVGVGAYTVTASLGACSSFSVTSVSIRPAPPLTATNNGPVCSGVQDTLLLQAASSPGATYSWSGPYTFSSLNQDPYRTPVSIEYAGVYQVTATLGGCVTTVNDTVIIRQTPKPPVVAWLTYCQFYPAPPLQAMGDSILWYSSMAPGVNGTLTAPVPSTGNIGISWYYTSQTLMGCTGYIDSVRVVVNPKPVISITNDTTLVCPHDSVTIRVNDADPLAYYQWSPSTYLSATTGAAVIARPEAGVHYTVIASNEFGCTDTARMAISVSAGAVLNLGDSVTLYPGESYQMNPQTNCSSFLWFPPSGLDNSHISDPVASPQISTKYIVRGETSWGCIAVDSINVTVSSDGLVALPNAFSPGTGPNNEFKIIKRGIVSLKYFRIFDRWGVEVFETTDIDEGWDGTYKGTPQPFGVYVYQVEAITNTGVDFEKHGNVTLIR